MIFGVGACLGRRDDDGCRREQARRDELLVILQRYAGQYRWRGGSSSDGRSCDRSGQGAGTRATGTTKAEVFDYYIDVAEAMKSRTSRAGRRPASAWPNGVDRARVPPRSSSPRRRRRWLDRATTTHKVGHDHLPGDRHRRRYLAWRRPSRPRSRSTCRNGSSSRAGAAGRVKTQTRSARRHASSSTSTPAKE